MNPFTHAHSFETPGFYMCSIVKCHKLLRSADQSLPHKYIVDKKWSLLLFTELGFDNDHSFNDLRCSSVYRKEL
jgi:hypothetical protein